VSPPHCDELVLHAPGECRFCDQVPHLQAARQAVGVAFSGHDPEPGQATCPSELPRTRETVARWPGNRAWPQGEPVDYFDIEGLQELLP